MLATSVELEAPSKVVLRIVSLVTESPLHVSDIEHRRPMNRIQPTRILLLLLSSLASGSPVAAASNATTSFVLIVTNNRSTRLPRPDLRYADDDGAKYYEVFRMVAAESNVGLLTAFDADTRKLYVKHPTEQMAELWGKDPDLKRLPRPEAAALRIRPQLGLGVVGLTGAF